jgi:uncharacterized protein with PIN domain
MSTTVVDQPLIQIPIDDPIEETDLNEQDGEAPPIFGRCPVCGKPLFPRDRITGEPKAPPPGTGYESRAKCGGCGTILCYMGGGKWRPLSEMDLSDEDRQADSFDKMFQ